MEQQNQQFQQNKINTKKKKDFKSEIKLFLIVALVAVVISVGGILLLKTMETSLPPAPSPQPQTLDTSTWQTYRNAEFGFEVKYPEGWTVEVDKLFSEFVIKSLETTSDIIISEMGNPENLSFDEWMRKISLLADPPLSRPLEEYLSFIGEARAYRFDSYPLDRPHTAISEIFIESLAKRIFALYPHSEVLEDHEVTNQILSTFRFVE